MRCSMPAAKRCTEPRGSGDAQRGAAALPASLAPARRLPVSPLARPPALRASRVRPQQGAACVRTQAERTRCAHAQRGAHRAPGCRL